MGKETTFGTGHAEAAIGVVARLILMLSTVLNLLVVLIGAVRGTAAKTERADGVSRHEYPIYGAWSIQPLDRSVGSAQPFAFGRIAEKSKNISPGSTRNRPSDIDRFVSVVFEKMLNIGSKRNNDFGRRDIVTALGGRAPHFEGHSANPTSSHVTAGGGKSASRAEGYFIPT